MAEEEEQDILERFLEALGKLADIGSKLNVAIPAIVIAARMIVLDQLDSTADGFKERKELLYLFERQVIGAWVLSNSSSVAGEGAGIALMALSPFAPEIGGLAKEAVARAKKNYENEADAAQTLYEIAKAITFPDLSAPAF